MVNELKKSLEACKIASDKQKTVKEKFRTVKAENLVLAKKLKFLMLEDIDKIDLVKLKQLESFFYKALDKTKELKFVQMVSLGLDVEEPDLKIWKDLGLNSTGQEKQDSDDSSLEFESSFYKSQKNTESSVDADA
jgi:hypothetical protein